MEWQPVETAPQTTRGFVLVAGWEQIPSLAYRRDGQWYDAKPFALFEVFEEPTHWMPIPTQPAAAVSQAQARESERKSLYSRGGRERRLILRPDLLRRNVNPSPPDLPFPKAADIP